MRDAREIRANAFWGAPWTSPRKKFADNELWWRSPLVINIVSMHRSIITIRSNTRRPRQARRLSGVSFPIITPKGLPPPRNSTWGCTTFAPSKGRPTSSMPLRAALFTPILYGCLPTTISLTERHTFSPQSQTSNCQCMEKHDVGYWYIERSCTGKRL